MARERVILVVGAAVISAIVLLLVACPPPTPPVCSTSASCEAGADAATVAETSVSIDSAIPDADAMLQDVAFSDAAPPPPAAMSLRVVGNHLVDASGRTVRLLGVNRSGQEFECAQNGTPTSRGWGLFDGPTDLASAQAIASWHATAVRVTLNEDCWLGINGINPQWGGSAYRSAIGAYVATLHQAGLYVIVDLHWNAPGAVPALSQQPMPDADHAVDFWRSVATQFASDQAVVFDLYNEPFLYASYQVNAAQDPWDLWLNGGGINQYLTGGQPYTQPLVWNAVGMQALVTAVRATGAKNPIMVGGLDWSNDLSGWLSHEPQDPAHALVASWHSYPGEACGALACWQSTVTPVAAVVPVVTGEIGDAVCTPTTYIDTLVPWMNAGGISFLGWTWNTWADCNDVLITSYAGTPTANYGQKFHDFLVGTTTLSAKKVRHPRHAAPKIAR